jgi:hypothetical protein
MVHRRVLAADLEHAAAGLDGVGDLFRLLDRVGHRLLEINVLAVLERGHRLRVVPVIWRGDDDDVHIRARADLAVIVVDRLLVDARRVACALLALVPDVVDRDRLNVAAFFASLHDAADMRVHAAAATDEADIDAIVGAEDAALRRRRHLGRVPRRLDPAARDHSRGRYGSAADLPDEVAPRRVLLRHVASALRGGRRVA